MLRFSVHKLQYTCETNWNMADGISAKRSQACHKFTTVAYFFSFSICFSYQYRQNRHINNQKGKPNRFHSWRLKTNTPSFLVQYEMSHGKLRVKGSSSSVTRDLKFPDHNSTTAARTCSSANFTN